MFKISKRKTSNNYYSYWQAIGLSFFSANIYVDAAKRWKGIAATYLLLLAFLLGSPIAFQFIQKTRHYFADTIEPAVAAMPPLAIHNGVISFDNQKSKKDAQLKTFWIWPHAPSAKHPTPDMVINLPRNIDSFNSLFIPILITNNTIQIQSHSPWGNRIVTDRFPVDKNQDGVLGSKNLNDMTHQIKVNLLTSALPYIAWLSWAVSIPCALLFGSVISLLSSALFRFRLPWFESVRVFVIAMTPPLIILEILYLTAQITRDRLIGLGILMALYYLFGARAAHFNRELVGRYD